VANKQVDTMTFEPGRSAEHEESEDSWRAADTEAFEAAVFAGIGDALVVERADPDTMEGGSTPYPPPYRGGASAYRNPDLFSADWRASSPDATLAEQPLIDHDDPAYRGLLKLLFERN
jgi:hypothetical protein